MATDGAAGGMAADTRPCPPPCPLEGAEAQTGGGGVQRDGAAAGEGMEGTEVVEGGGAEGTANGAAVTAPRKHGRGGEEADGGSGGGGAPLGRAAKRRARKHGSNGKARRDWWDEHK